MTITLDTVTLNDEMLWSDRDKSFSVAQSIETTLQGTPIITSQQLSGTKPITLTATTEQGWLQKTVVDQLLALAEVAGATYTLTIAVRSMTPYVANVVFRHADAPAVDLQPLIAKQDTQPTDYFIGEIKLLQLS